MAHARRAEGADPGSPAEARALQIEANGINVISDAERKGKPHDLFWPWFAANVSVLGLSYGAFVLGFGISFWQAVVVGLAGIIISFDGSNLRGITTTQSGAVAVVIAFLTITLTGCGGLQEAWEGPGASAFRPNSIAVLPPIIGALEGSREVAHEVVTAGLKKSNRYAVVVDQEQIKDFLIKSNDTRETFAKLLSTLESTGLSEQEAAVKLGKALKVDGETIDITDLRGHTTVDAKVGK